MSTRLIWSLVVVVGFGVAACGNHSSQTPQPDAANGALDAAAADAMASDGRDPAQCPVGVADGCCPSGQQYGGHDPDCPSLACATLAASDPIPLDPDWLPTGQGGVGMAWTGAELVMAWSSHRVASAQTIATIVSERRDGAGAITSGPTTNDDGYTYGTVDHSQAELGFEPASHEILFVSDTAYHRYGELLDQQGRSASAPLVLAEACIPILDRAQIYPWNGSFLVAQNSDVCDHSAQPQGAVVDVLGGDGARTASSYGDTAYQIGMAYDAAAGRILFTSGNAGLVTRWFDPPSTWSGTTTLHTFTTYDTAASYDGSHYAISYGNYTYNPGLTTDPQLEEWTFPTNGAPTGTPTTGLISDPNIQQVPPRLVWTGDGWIELVTIYPSNHSGLPDQWSSFTTWVVSVAPDGTVREKLPLDPSSPSYLVNAIWAGGRVAVTWVATDGQHERHYLRWLGCP
jgi:hypothetical protein